MCLNVRAYRARASISRWVKCVHLEDLWVVPHPRHAARRVQEIDAVVCEGCHRHAAVLGEGRGRGNERQGLYRLDRGWIRGYIG